jgi:hypothetical protein
MQLKDFYCKGGRGRSPLVQVRCFQKNELNFDGVLFILPPSFRVGA